MPAKMPKRLEPGPTLLAVDPSLRATGWIVVLLQTEKVIAAGVIRTTQGTPEERKRQLRADLQLQSGLQIYQALVRVIDFYSPRLAYQEANGGSKSMRAATALARAQQACGDAIASRLGVPPILVSPQAVKKAATGVLNASKQQVEASMRRRFPTADFDALLTERPIYATEGQRNPPRGLWENAFDAAAVAHWAFGHPSQAWARGSSRYVE